jgi:hypothetical protein
MKSTLLALATAAALGLTANASFAQEAGFGGDPSASKNQVPGPSVSNPSDPAAGNPGSPAQVPTAPEVQEDLYDSSAASTAAASDSAVKKPASSDPH